MDWGREGEMENRKDVELRKRRDEMRKTKPKGREKRPSSVKLEVEEELDRKTKMKTKRRGDK
ncbi:hypothetical protein BDY24DRAFT_384834 [Mrakia frigida]|uniref:uncharacterized protein n=1 Tax=Mrakia frigida TaxID=29902 RepID=UPI003FCC2105